MPARFDSGPHHDGLGVTHDLEMATATALRVDAGAWFAAAWPSTLRVPTFTEVLDELGGRTVLCPEAMNAGAGQAIVDQLFRLGLVDTAIVQSFMRAELTGAITVGGTAMALTATSSYDVAELRAAGIRYLGLSAALPPSLVAGHRSWPGRGRVGRRASGGLGAFAHRGRRRFYPTTRSTRPADLRYWYPTRTDGARTTTGTWPAPSPATAGNSSRHTGYMDTSPEYKGALRGWVPVQSAVPVLA